MSTVELATRPRAAEWAAIGTTVRVVVTEPDLLPAATDIVVAELAALDAACSRFRPDSEVTRLANASGRPVGVSRLLADAVGVALDAARRTDGDLDPTVGAAMASLGYDRDFAEVHTRPGGPAVRVAVRPSGWRQVRLDRERRLITVPAGTLLDLGATAKAWAADRCASRVAQELGCGVLVSLGGDIATAGSGPDGGWIVRVQDRPDVATDPTACTVTLQPGGALATSSIGSRAWRQGRDRLHHILNPRTLRPAEAVWRYATVAAASCVDANTASTVALIRGRAAPAWLHSLGLSARLVTADGRVARLGGWPAEGLS